MGRFLKKCLGLILHPGHQGEDLIVWNVVWYPFSNFLVYWRGWLFTRRYILLYLAKTDIDLLLIFHLIFLSTFFLQFTAGKHVRIFLRLEMVIMYAWGWRVRERSKEKTDWEETTKGGPQWSRKPWGGVYLVLTVDLWFGYGAEQHLSHLDLQDRTTVSVQPVEVG